MSEITGEYILIMTMTVGIAIAVIIAIVMTSLYAAKKGTNTEMTDEIKFLDTMASSTACECIKKA